jgi:hypothetical protein
MLHRHSDSRNLAVSDFTNIVLRPGESQDRDERNTENLAKRRMPQAGTCANATALPTSGDIVRWDDVPMNQQIGEFRRKGQGELGVPPGMILMQVSMALRFRGKDLLMRPRRLRRNVDVR